MPKLNLSILVFGSSVDDATDSSGTRGITPRSVKIRLSPMAPAEIMHDPMQLHGWCKGYMHGIVRDIKHSHDWHCEFCDQPAREARLQLLAHGQLGKPSVLVYVHLLCEAVSGPCAQSFQDKIRDMARASGVSLSTSPDSTSSDSQRGPSLSPAAGSCMACNREETVGQALGRCGKCKLTRYCSVECQHADWDRHQPHCRTIKGLTWEWN